MGQSGQLGTAMRTKNILLATLVVGATVFTPAAAVAQELPMCSPTTIETILAPEPDADDTLDFAPLPGAPGAVEAAPRQIEVVVEQENCTPFIYPMLSPYGERPSVISVFAADRPNGRLHKGADLSNPKMTPVYAVSDGVVTWILDEREGDCCALAVRHPDGWTSYYIHLNNDTFGTDDGRGYGIAPGLGLDSQVAAGQLIGWVGDSGNAEETPPHVHFELRMPGSIAVDPAASLDAATVTASFGLSATFVEPFSDDDGTAIEPVLGRLASLGMITGCGEPTGTRFCPDDPVTGSDAVAFIEAFVGVTIDPNSLLDHASTSDASLTEIRTALENNPCSVLYCDNTKLDPADIETLLSFAFAQVTPDQTLSEVASEMPQLLLGRCEDVSPESISTRADLVVFLAQETGLLTTVPCGTLR